VIKKENAARKPPLAQEQRPRPSTQQFNATPRFTFSSTPRPTATPNAPGATPSAARYFTPASKTPKAKEQDAIENSSHEPHYSLHDSIEIDDTETDPDYGFGDGEDDYKLEEPTPKRRRTSTSPGLQEDQGLDDPNKDTYDDHQDYLSSSLPALSSPPAPRRPISTNAPRFLNPTAPPSTPQVSAANQTTFLKPPRFRPPDPSEQAQAKSDPLPEQFSPHRRGQKYVPGGLAAEVRDWLMNIESAIPANKNKDDPWLVKLVVDEVSGGGGAGMTLVRGRQIQAIDGGEMVDTLDEVKVILAGEGAGVGLQKGSKVEPGKRLGVKGPVWEVVIEGERWGVGVDWRVLP
jgi:hypothetical protein